MAFDIGKKRIGVATTDGLQMIASPLRTVEAKEVWSFLKSELSLDIPERIIVGMPKGLDGKDTDGTVFAQKFVDTFTKRYPNIPVELADERFTSTMALGALHQMGKKTKGNKALIDEMSAALILQGFLDRKR